MARSDLPRRQLKRGPPLEETAIDNLHFWASSILLKGILENGNLYNDASSHPPAARLRPLVPGAETALNAERSATPLNLKTGN